MPVIQAQDIVNAAIQDSQSLTTNRPALYDYTDRIHQRILRESQWRFLLSDPQQFVTIPGVATYTLVSGTAPAGSFQTNLNLTNFANIAPGSVFDLTTGTQLFEDSDVQMVQKSIINKDGSLRKGFPRTYSNSIYNPGTITIMPVPDGENLYYPVPETPVVISAYNAGCTLPTRIYFGVVTFVDSLGGEGTPCAIPFTIAVPAGYQVTVESPNASIGQIAGNQASYGYWNLYMGYSLGVYNRQNFTPINIGTSWTEPILGISTGTLQVPSTSNLPPGPQGTVLSITNSGFLGTTTLGQPVYPSFWAIEDTNGILWQVSTNGSGILTTTQVAPNPGLINVYNAIYLTDVSNISTWKITVSITGQLQSTVYSTPPTTAAVNGIPPTSPSIQPLNAYVIQFRYYQTRNQIVNPTDVLQIPYAYKDIVIAGVNHLTNLYRDPGGQPEPSAKANEWKQYFERGLAQIRRDLRVNYRKTDFIGPDPTSQYVVANQEGIPTMGW